MTNNSSNSTTSQFNSTYVSNLWDNQVRILLNGLTSSNHLHFILLTDKFLYLLVNESYDLLTFNVTLYPIT